MALSSLPVIQKGNTMLKIDTSKPYSSVKEEFIKENPSPWEVLHACTHPDPIQVKKLDSAYRPMYKLQCLHCGKTFKQLKKTDVNRDLPVWPWQSKHAEDIRARAASDYEVWREKVNRLWRDYYDAYLSSPEWQEKRRQVIALCGNKCQACGANPVQHVHHLNYQNLGNEPLSELAGVCESCHRAMHRHMWQQPITTAMVVDRMRQVAA